MKHIDIVSQNKEQKATFFSKILFFRICLLKGFEILNFDFSSIDSSQTTMSKFSKESSSFAWRILELVFVSSDAVFGTMISVIAVLDNLFCIASFSFLIRSFLTIFFLSSFAFLRKALFVDAFDLLESERIDHSEPASEREVNEKCFSFSISEMMLSLKSII